MQRIKRFRVSLACDFTLIDHRTLQIHSIDFLGGLFVNIRLLDHFKIVLVTLILPCSIYLLLGLIYDSRRYSINSMRIVHVTCSSE